MNTQRRWYSTGGWIDVKAGSDGIQVVLGDGDTGAQIQIEMGPRSTRELIRVLREGLKKVAE